MTRPLLFHIGYHKTATTWMQRLLLTAEHGFYKIASHREVFRHVVQPHGLRFDPEALRLLISDRLKSVPDGAVPVISSEILSGHPFQGGHESDVYADRLARIAPQARILISIRNQMKILPSVYMQYLMRGGTMPVAEFFEGTDEVGYFGFTPQHFEYDLLVAHYQRLFGAQNVHVLTQESIRDDMEAAAAQVAAFSGNATYTALTQAARRVNAASYPEYAAPLLRRINHVQASTLNPSPFLRLGRTPKGLYKAVGYLVKRQGVASLMAGRRPVSDHVRSRFSGYFRDSNARLAAIAGHPLDLSEYD